MSFKAILHSPFICSSTDLTRQNSTKPGRYAIHATATAPRTFASCESSFTVARCLGTWYMVPSEQSKVGAEHGRSRGTIGAGVRPGNGSFYGRSGYGRRSYYARDTYGRDFRLGSWDGERRGGRQARNTGVSRGPANPTAHRRGARPGPKSATRYSNYTSTSAAPHEAQTHPSQ